MTPTRPCRTAGGLIALATAATLLAALAGCASQPQAAAGTAKSNLPLAQSRIATTAPDAKFLLVQTGNVVTATSTPIWTYLFGSPKSGAIYAVMIQNGNASAPAPYGTAGLSAKEWAEVPGIDAWKVDSDAALDKALASASLQGKAVPYAMGMVSYVPKAATATVEPFVWNVVLDPEATGGAKPKTVSIDAATGQVKATK
jgi:hypothetical protein